MLGTCAILFNVKLFVQMTKFFCWENICICCEQILEYLHKVNKKTFASDMFRVFLFSSHKKLN